MMSFIMLVLAAVFSLLAQLISLRARFDQIVLLLVTNQTITITGFPFRSSIHCFHRPYLGTLSIILMLIVVT